MPFPRTALLLFVTLVVSARPTFAQAPSEHETQQSCRKFVQDFYDWYLTKALAGKLPSPSSKLALQRKPEVFSTELYRRLKEDRDAQDKTPGELVGLDFDPFLNSQDPSPYFTVVGITRKGASYWVDVYGVDSGKRQEHVIPELVQQNGHWVFVNFHYGKNEWSDDANLLSILKTLRDERQKNPQ
jgi:hypothetical protein